MEFQHLTIAGKQHSETEVFCITDSLVKALKSTRGVIVSFGDKAMIDASHLKAICQICKNNRIEFTIKDGEVSYQMSDGTIQMKGTFDPWQMADTVTNYKGVKSHVKTIIVLSWTYAYQPVIAEPLPAPTTPAIVPDPLPVPIHAPKVKRARVARPKPVKMPACKPLTVWDRLWLSFARIAPVLGSIVVI